jgi:hypothetical protein
MELCALVSSAPVSHRSGLRSKQEGSGNFVAGKPEGNGNFVAGKPKDRN